MIWLTWRQFRTQALAGAAALAAAAACLLLLGLRIHHDYQAQLAGCIARGCAAGLTSGFEDRFGITLQLTGLALTAVPGLLGAFWGAPLISGELAAGTHRLAWQQSVGRTRWLAVKLLVVGGAAVAVTGLLDLLLTWAAGPYDTVRGDRFTPLVFAARGVVPPACAAFAFALGAATGLLLRRPVAAMALTLLGCAAVQFAVPTFLRPDYLPPRTAEIRLDATTLGHADGIVLNGSSLTIGGIALPNSWVVSTGRAVDPAGQAPNGRQVTACLAPGRFDDSIGCLAAQNLRVRAVYQPAGRYWPFQWIETALYCAMSAGLVGLCFFWVRSRAA